MNRRKLITSAAVAPLIIKDAKAHATSRTLLTAQTILYCGTAAPGCGTYGSTTGLTADYPNLQAAINDLAATKDLGNQNVQLLLLDGSTDPGFTKYGLFVGQSGPSVVVRASSLGAATIRPSGGAACIGIAFDAIMVIENLVLDGGTQGSAGHPQDVIQLGQGALLSMYGSNRIIQNSTSYNGITINGPCVVDHNPQSYGSPIQNGGYIYWQGQFQCGVQTDGGGVLSCNANGQHGLLAWFMEAGQGQPKPYWAVDFLDTADGEIHVDGVDFHGTANGYAYRVRPGGILYVNQVQDPNQLNAIPGSVRTAWPVGTANNAGSII